ncbi:MAG: hypothetical protein WA610_08115 [Thermodesulfovibrionales bacterium]
MSKSSHKIIIFVLVSLVVLISSLFLLRDIYDPDFFWHIKTGEWIWQHKTLPSEDPFAYTSVGHHTGREHFILTSFWLSQVTYHLFYLAGGLTGIVILRFLMAGVLLYALWKRKHGDDIVYLGLLLVFLTYFLKQFPVERPQVFSFLFFAVLLYLLERIGENTLRIQPTPLPLPGGDHVIFPSREGCRGGSSREGCMGGSSREGCRGGFLSVFFLLPLLMLIWANMHPGFIIGHVTIILYIVMEGVKFLRPSFRPIGIKAYKRLCLAAGSGIIFSLANPNTYHVWQEYWEYKIPVEHWNLSAGYLSAVNPDYMTSIQYFLWSGDYSVILYWLLILLAFAGLAVNRKNTDLTDLALLMATGVASFLSARYSFFFMAAALPVIARHFSGDRLLKFGRAAVPAIAIVAGIFFTWSDRHNLEHIRSGVQVDGYLCPVKAADFIIANDIRGNMYNVYEWGGYLIWRLAPERKVFVDPRDIFGDATRESTLMDSASGGEVPGAPAWKTIVGTRNINYIVIPIARTTGAVVPLFNALILDKDWLPVFCDINAVIFVEDSPVNEQVIRKYSIPKDYLMNALIGLYDRLIATYPDDWKASLYITKGDLHLSQGDASRAVGSYEKAVELAPLNVIAKDRLNILRR